MKKFINAIAVLVLLISCSEGENVTISNQVLQGKVFNLDFVAKGGKAFDSGDKISVNITNISADCESSVFDFEYKVTVYVEKKLGTYKDKNVIFSKKGETPINQLGSTVVVEEITDSEITVKIKSNFKSDNSVEGKFTVPYCE